MAFYGMDKAVGALEGSLSGGSKGSTDVWDMTEGGGIIMVENIPSMPWKEWHQTRHRLEQN